MTIRLVALVEALVLVLIHILIWFIEGAETLLLEIEAEIFFLGYLEGSPFLSKYECIFLVLVIVKVLSESKNDDELDYVISDKGDSFALIFCFFFIWIMIILKRILVFV